MAQFDEVSVVSCVSELAFMLPFAVKDDRRGKDIKKLRRRLRDSGLKRLDAEPSSPGRFRYCYRLTFGNCETAVLRFGALNPRLGRDGIEVELPLKDIDQRDLKLLGLRLRQLLGKEFRSLCAAGWATSMTTEVCIRDVTFGRAMPRYSAKHGRSV